MGEMVFDKEIRQAYREAIQKLDDDVREIEEIHEEMDEYLYGIEKRIARLRYSKRD